MAPLKGIPKNEIVWERICDEQGNITHLITSDSRREFYFIYKSVDGGFQKLGRAKNPPDLLRRYGE